MSTGRLAIPSHHSRPIAATDPSADVVVILALFPVQEVARVDAGAGRFARHRHRDRLLAGADAVLLQVERRAELPAPSSAGPKIPISTGSSIGTSVSTPRCRPRSSAPARRASPARCLSGLLAAARSVSSFQNVFTSKRSCSRDCSESGVTAFSSRYRSSVVASGASGRFVRLAQAAQRSVHPSSPRYSLKAYSANGPLR